MTRDEQIRKVESGFAALVRFAGESWSNLAIVEQLKAWHQDVKTLYPPVVVEVAAPPPPPPPVSPQKPKQPRKPRRPRQPPAQRESEHFEPVHVDANTRWG